MNDYKNEIKHNLQSINNFLTNSKDAEKKEMCYEEMKEKLPEVFETFVKSQDIDVQNDCLIFFSDCIRSGNDGVLGLLNEMDLANSMFSVFLESTVFAFQTTILFVISLYVYAIPERYDERYLKAAIQYFVEIEKITPENASQIALIVVSIFCLINEDFILQNVEKIYAQIYKLLNLTNSADESVFMFAKSILAFLIKINVTKAEINQEVLHIHVSFILEIITRTSSIDYGKRAYFFYNLLYYEYISYEDDTTYEIVAIICNNAKQCKGTAFDVLRFCEYYDFFFSDEELITLSVDTITNLQESNDLLSVLKFLNKIPFKDDPYHALFFKNMLYPLPDKIIPGLNYHIQNGVNSTVSKAGKLLCRIISRYYGLFTNLEIWKKDDIKIGNGDIWYTFLHMLDSGSKIATIAMSTLDGFYHNLNMKDPEFANAFLACIEEAGIVDTIINLQDEGDEDVSCIAESFLQDIYPKET